jgi:hypothetical protein
MTILFIQFFHICSGKKPIVIFSSFFKKLWHGFLFFLIKSIVMTNVSNSVVKPDVLEENKMTIHSFLKESYNQAKKQWDEGVTFFKDEFSAFYNKTGEYIDRMLLPVNNFLKDIKQIESELKQEISKESTELVFLDGSLVTIDQALSLPMEENY